MDNPIQKQAAEKLLTEGLVKRDLVINTITSKKNEAQSPSLSRKEKWLLCIFAACCFLIIYAFFFMLRIG